jgi:hypothetical protein
MKSTRISKSRTQKGKSKIKVSRNKSILLIIGITFFGMWLVIPNFIFWFLLAFFVVLIPLIFLVSVLLLLYNTAQRVFYKRNPLSNSDIYKAAKIMTVVLGVIYMPFYLVTIGLIWSLGGCNPPGFSDKYYSPDRKYYAQSRIVGCGGAAGSSTYDAAIFRTEDTKHEFDYGQNIVSTRFHGGFDFEWVTNRKLKVSHKEDCDEKKENDKSWNDVAIVFDSQCTTNN